MGATSSASVLRPVLLNNLAVVHHHCGKHHLAALYLSMALGSNSSGSSSSSSGAHAWQGPSVCSGSSNNRDHGRTAAGPAGPGPLSRSRDVLVGGEGGGRCVQGCSGTVSVVGVGLGKSAEEGEVTCTGPLAPAVMYNLGIQHLLLQRWAPALKCFRAAAHVYHNQVCALVCVCVCVSVFLQVRVLVCQGGYVCVWRGGRQGAAMAVYRSLVCVCL